MIIAIITISIFIIFLFFYIKINNKLDNIKIIENKNKEIEEEKNKLEKEIIKKEEKLSYLIETIENKKHSLETLYENYSDVLDYNYREKEKEYDNYLNILQNNYNNKQSTILKEIEENEDILKEIKKTRISAQEALLKEKEIKDNLSFYCLNITKEDLDDIEILERIKPKLNNPRVLCMLIWSTYYQKPMTLLCNNVLGVNEVSGIYKITNQKTQQCYIGQAVDVAKRFKDHAKSGLGIDTPANNKLYKSMQEYGLINFSFELLEKCTKDKLNEKEKYYINLYQSYEYGFNSNKGNSK